MPAYEAVLERGRRRLRELSGQRAVITRLGRDLPPTFEQVEVSVLYRDAAKTLTSNPDALPRFAKDRGHVCGTFRA